MSRRRKCGMYRISNLLTKEQKESIETKTRDVVESRNVLSSTVN